jgi:hypothetical protein
VSEKNEKTAWNLEAVYDSEIAPLMAQIIQICQRVDMPMVASFAYENDVGGRGLGLCTTQLGSFQPEQIRRAGTALRSNGGPPPMKLTTERADGSKIITVIV